MLRSRGPVSVLGVRFKPAGAWAFVGAALSSCTDLRIDFAALAGAAEASALGARLGEPRARRSGSRC